MSLREELEHRRLAKTAVGETANDKPENAAPAPAMSPPVFLRLVKANKQCWLLPWACFHGVSYELNVTIGDDATNCEQLHLIFMRHEVTVQGVNLGDVIDAIENISLRELCEMSEKYQPVANALPTTTVTTICVNAR